VETGGDGVVRVDADAVKAVELRVFVAAVIHAENQFMPNRAEMHSANGIVAEGELRRLSARDRDQPNLRNASRVSQIRNKATVWGKARRGRGPDVQVAVDRKLMRHDSFSLPEIVPG